MEEKIWGFYDDDGNKINPNFTSRPPLCALCKLNDDPNEEVLCTLQRIGYKKENDFECAAFEKV